MTPGELLLYAAIALGFGLVALAVKVF